MIRPTVGRIVWFWGGERYDDRQPEAATVCYVHSDRVVNLLVIGHDGTPRPVSSVQLVQEGDLTPDTSYFCEWMPYQKSQAAKTEPFEKAAGAATADQR